MRALASQQLLGLYGPAGKLGRPLLSAAGTRACETAVRCPLGAARALGNSLPSSANSTQLGRIKKNRQKGIQKIREIVESYLCMQRFHKF